MAKKDDVLTVEGVVLEILLGSQCKVEIGGGSTGMPKTVVTAYLSGKMRKHFIRIIPGDKVKVEFSTYDLSKGRIVYRETNADIKKAT